MASAPLDENGSISRSLSVVSISPTESADGRFTEYEIEVMSSDTDGSWTVRRRYSEFLVLRKRLTDMLGMLHNCSGCCMTVRSVLRHNFPRKHLLSSRSARVKEERRQGLMAFVCQMLDCTTGLVFRNCQWALDKGVLSIIEDFLIPAEVRSSVPTAQGAAELALAKLPVVSTEELQSGQHEDVCLICLDDEEDDIVLKMPCGHMHHRSCLLDWFTITLDCPKCREPAL